MVIGQKNVYSKKVANTQPKWSFKKIHNCLFLSDKNTWINETGWLLLMPSHRDFGKTNRI